MRRGAHRRQPATLLLALGGGTRRGLLARLVRILVGLRPGLRIRIAGGFAGGAAPSSQAGVVWLPPLRGLGTELRRCTAAVLAGGVTLYEACCLGVPAVAVAVVPAQRPTIRAFARRGAVLDGRDLPAGCPNAQARLHRLARQVLALLDDARRRRALARRGRADVDGRGALRVARALRSLVPAAPAGSGAHA
jgi:spore coat polysaccharide biosynthesis predicted glycosyltransferase SpsG